MGNLKVWGVIFIVLSLIGCGSEKSRLAGHYRGTGDVSDASHAMNPEQTIDLREDGTFTFDSMGVPVQGSWTVEGTKVTLNPTKVGGVAVAGKQRPMILDVEGDSKLTIEGAEPNTNIGTFVKSGA